MFAPVKIEVVLPNNKSILIRQLMADFVRKGTVPAMNDDESTDVQVTCRALQMIHAARATSEFVRIDVRDCGTAYRFMMALLAVTPGRWLLTGTERLLQRPMEELADVLTGIGANIERAPDGWHVVGRTLHAESLTVDCTRSSQYASALLLIASEIGLKTLHVTPANASSIPYIQLTRTVTHADVAVPELPDPVKPLGRVGDWSAAVYGYAMALLHPEDTFELLNVSLESAQGDAVVAEWFREMGVESKETEKGVVLQVRNPNAEIGPIRFDVSQHLDLVPVLAALACLLPADFTFEGIRNLAFKESNRASTLAEQLAPYAGIELDDNKLRIVGWSKNQWPQPPYLFNTYHDHRLVMGFSLFGANAQLDDVECVHKSWKNFPSLGDL